MLLDLQVHSNYSYDGKITYDELLSYAGVIDVIAITDHNNFDFHYRHRGNRIGVAYKLGNLQIIPAEEIMTSDAGEIIGLFLKDYVQEGLTMSETIKDIKKQNGLVYVPHPFDLYRKKSRPNMRTVTELINEVDIVEVNNGKYFTRYEHLKANTYALKYNKPISAGSDAHKFEELGRTWIEVKSKTPLSTSRDLLSMLNGPVSIVKHNPKALKRIVNKVKKVVIG
jgi:predicted metal-dependent phosphoesterase TrpH